MILRFFAIFWLLSALGSGPAEPSPLSITIDDGLLRTFPALPDDLQRRADDYDITLSYVDETSESASAAGVVLGLSAQDDDLLITLNQPEQLNISSVPVPVYHQPIQLDLDLASENGLDTLTGWILYAAGQCQAALSYLKDSVDANAFEEISGASALNFYIGNCLLEKEDYTGALELFDAIIRYDDDDRLLHSAPYINAIWANITMGHDDQVQFRLDTDSLEHAQDAAEQPIRIHRARLYALAFRFDDALALINTAIEAAPDDGALFIERGQIRMLLYEWDQVAEDYTTAISLNPELTEAYFHRGVLYYSILEREQALADFETYLQQEPDGTHAAAATNYADAIRAELDALDG